MINLKLYGEIYDLISTYRFQGELESLTTSFIHVELSMQYFFRVKLFWVFTCTPFVYPLSQVKTFYLS